MFTREYLGDENDTIATTEQHEPDTTAHEKGKRIIQPEMDGAEMLGGLSPRISLTKSIVKDVVGSNGVRVALV